MVAFSSLLAAAVAIAGSALIVSAEYLAVTKFITQVGGGQNCQDTAPLYQIYSWKDQTPKDIGCKGVGSSIARSNNAKGTKLDGCNDGGYTNGYRVCLTGYGGNVHNNKGQHQRCLTDNTTVQYCPLGYCISYTKRVLMCDGVWRPNA